MDCRLNIAVCWKMSRSLSKTNPRRRSSTTLAWSPRTIYSGLYSGVSRDNDSFFNAGGQLPARISIYRGPIMRLCRSAEEVVQEVRDTVVHEIGHHFGLDDDEMPY